MARRARPAAAGSPLGALVHPIAVATCDMDCPLYMGHLPFLLPLHLGHECVAEVMAIGDGVQGFAVGDRVLFVPFQINCGTCPPCRAGHTGNCVSVLPGSCYGFGLAMGHWGGAYSDVLAVPYADAMLVPLPPDVDPAHAASVADNVAEAYRSVAPRLSRDPRARRGRPRRHRGRAESPLAVQVEHRPLRGPHRARPRGP